MNEIIVFGELVSSNNFFLLFERGFNLINHFTNLGAYEQGIPIRNTVDFVWGTNSGIRSFPILLGLFFLQQLFASTWIDVYLGILLILPFFTFLIAHRLIGRIHLFSIVGALFFAGNVWIITRIFSGFWQLNVVYAFLPFLVYIPFTIAKQKKMTLYKSLFLIILYALATSVVLTAQPHFLIMVLIFSIIHLVTFIIKKNFIALKRLIRFYFVAIIFFLFINLYFFVPGAFFPEHSFTASSQYFSLAAVKFNGQGAQIENILRFAIEFPYKPFSWGWQEYVQLIPLSLVIVFFVLNKKRSWVYAFCLLIFLFLAKGLNEPGLQVSEWLYQNVFFLHFFRDPSRFIAGMTLFASCIIAGYTTKKRISLTIKFIIIFLSVGIIIITNVASFADEKIAILKKTTIPQAYNNLQTFMQNTITTTNERVLSLPNTHGMVKYSWYHNPSPATAGTTFDVLTPLPIPLANSSNYPDNFSNQLSAFLYHEYIKTYDERLLRPLGVKYVIVDESIAKPYAEHDVATQAAKVLLQNTKSYERVFFDTPLSLYKIKTDAPLLSNQKPLFAIGNFTTIKNLYKSGSTRPVILLNQTINNQLIHTSLLRDNDLLIDIKDPILTMTAERLAVNYDIDMLKAGWDYDKVFVNTEPYKMKYILQNGQLFTSGRMVGSQNRTGFMHVNHKNSPGKYKILIKALTEVNPSTIKLTIGDENKIITVDSQNTLLWLDAGSIEVAKQQSVVTITKNDENVFLIDYLLLVPEDIYNTNQKNISSVLKTMETYDNANAQKEKNSLTLRGSDVISATNPTQNFTFRFSYGDYWKTDAPSTTYISDGYGMTFIATSDKGIKRVSYGPNTFFIISSVISICITFILIIYILCYLFRKKLQKFFNK